MFNLDGDYSILKYRNLNLKEKTFLTSVTLTEVKYYTYSSNKTEFNYLIPVHLPNLTEEQAIANFRIFFDEIPNFGLFGVNHEETKILLTSTVLRLLLINSLTILNTRN